MVCGVLAGCVFATHTEPVAARQAVRAETSERYYEVGAETISGVIERLNGMRLRGANGPLSQGLTRYDIRPEYRALASGGLCRVSSLRVEVVITITLPSWSMAPSRPDEERKRWTTIQDAIRSHEYGHRDLTIEAAEELAESLRGIEARGCGTLRRVVANELAVADGRLREAHAELDRSTPLRLPVG